jgi:hypothetical protein
MKLTLEEIWKMADLLEEAQKIKISGKKTLEEEPQLKTQERVLRLPKLQISENWGKADTVERQELENIVYTATKGPKDPFSKLAAIQQQMTSIATGEAIKNPKKILSQIILLETLNRMFKSFQPSPAGFINEAFLSVIYGTTQKDALKANAEGDIGDITDDGVPVSLKTLTGNAPVKGSVANLVNSINNTEGEKVYFDLYLKNSSGADSEVGELRVLRFVVDGSNINQFLQLPKDTIKINPSTGKLEFPEQSLKEGFIISELDDESVPDLGAGLTPEAEAEFNKAFSKGKLRSDIGFDKQGQLAFNVLKLNNFEMPKVGRFTEFVNNLQNQSLSKLSDLLYSESDDPKVRQLLKTITSTEIGKSKVAQTTAKKGDQFEIPYGHWSTFVKNYGQKQITLEFSDKKLQAIMQNAVKSLDASITEIFNNLADFTSTLQSYLTSTKEGRGNEGQKAVELAKKLKPSTEKVVKTGAVEQD